MKTIKKHPYSEQWSLSPILLDISEKKGTDPCQKLCPLAKFYQATQKDDMMVLKASRSPICPHCTFPINLMEMSICHSGDQSNINII